MPHQISPEFEFLAKGTKVTIIKNLWALRKSLRWKYYPTVLNVVFTIQLMIKLSRINEKSRTCGFSFTQNIEFFCLKIVCSSCYVQQTIIEQKKSIFWVKLRPYTRNTSFILLYKWMFNRSCLSGITCPGQVKIQIVREVNWGQYKNKLLIWLFSDMPNSWDMAQYVKNRPKMKTEKTEKWWYFLKDDDHRWSFGNRNIGGNYWKTAKT